MLTNDEWDRAAGKLMRKPIRCDCLSPFLVLLLPIWKFQTNSAKQTFKNNIWKQISITELDGGQSILNYSTQFTISSSNTINIWAPICLPTCFKCRPGFSVWTSHQIRHVQLALVLSNCQKFWLKIWNSWSVQLASPIDWEILLRVWKAPFRVSN